MIHSCELCGNDFLTEADPYVVRPTFSGVRLYCMCQIKGFDEMKGAEKLKEENKKLVECVKFYANKNNPNFIVNLDYHDETDCDFHEDTQLTHFGKLARQVLKEIGEE